MRVGERYVPWGRFRGGLLPMGLAAYTGISASAKIVFSILSYRSDDAGEAWPSREQLAHECGMSLRCVGVCLNELVSEGFIMVCGRRDRRVVYGFVEHECLSASVRNLQCSPNRSVQNMPDSKRGSVQNMPTTSDIDQANTADVVVEPARDTIEEGNHAESAHDSVQILPTISGKICTLQGGYLINTLPDNEGIIPPLPDGTRINKPPSPKTGGERGGGFSSPPSAIRGRASPGGMDIFERIRAVIPTQRVSDYALDRRLGSWLKTYGLELVDRLASSMEDRAGDLEARPINNPLGWGTAILEKWQKEQIGNGRTDADYRNGLPVNVGM